MVWRNFCLFILWMGAAGAPAPIFAQEQNHTIAFASDTQEPLLIEKVIRKTNHNQQATKLIFQDIVAGQPSSLFILGDVVSLGCQDSKWKRMDVYLGACRQHNIPVYAVLGNHELMLNASRGAAKFQERFPIHHSTGYVEKVDSVAVVLLNSNFSKMTDAEIEKQDDWYQHTITELDHDAAIKFVIVGCHHSPFTNSKVVAPSLKVQQQFVPAFVNSKKGVLFLSGHSHNFEHFNIQGKNFLVIGGGGGPHQPLRTGKRVIHDTDSSYKPMFHYLEVKRSGDSLQVVSRQLKADFSGFTDGLTFYVHRF
ncbi:metallophosphoesterase family protein [Mucilaginibacter sp. SP1R1]|uniref:metallophosphoesterase family protein n=1 Tax=Mucilaginibacter sp. SP1R1 TaxID=2723091 RepID=UPI0018591071|nr:metallophosphoesterase [Mucilaginibacter sp. SP1R1]MBB6151598.1 putative MPP superfamily phosphohydrolase [Mucilaginibacter sp. SP1R1]